MAITEHKTGPRDVFLYLLAIITLYISIWRFIDLLFEYINALFPDALAGQYYGIGSFDEVRLSIATLIVVFPIYLGLTYFLRKDVIAHPEKRELKIRKWLLNFTLFLAAVMFIADLVTLINTFLSGEITVRFVLKVLVVLVVAAAVSVYYFWDMRRETLPHSKPSKPLVWIASGVMAISIVSGFFIIGSPMQQRQLRFDSERINHMQIIQNEVINYWMLKNTLPVSLADLRNDISGFAVPADPETGAPYEYAVKAPLRFELCANFAQPSGAVAANGAGTSKFPVPSYAPYPAYGQNWEHPVGRGCFERTIDPQLYKPMVRPY